MLGTEFVFLFRIRPEYWVMLVNNNVHKMLLCWTETNLLLSFNGRIASNVDCYNKTSVATMRSLSIVALNVSLSTV
jgi:hypothetical protein